jgi:hypothetical protein
MIIMFGPPLKHYFCLRPCSLTPLPRSSNFLGQRSLPPLSSQDSTRTMIRFWRWCSGVTLWCPHALNWANGCWLPLFLDVPLCKRGQTRVDDEERNHWLPRRWPLYLNSTPSIVKRVYFQLSLRVKHFKFWPSFCKNLTIFFKPNSYMLKICFIVNVMVLI